MTYYKIITDSLVDIATNKDFKKYQRKHNIVLQSKKKQAQYIEGVKGILYHTDWMCKIISEQYSYQDATLLEITEEEYELLYNTLQTENELTEVPFVEIDYFYDKEVETVEPKLEEEPTTEYIRSVKLAEMNSTCNKTITNGFDITLSDGNSYHFSLTTQDQLNLITLASMVEGGETQIPYHADGEPCKFYSVEDINAIITKATEFKTYHISYFNSLKIYINSMETKEEIATVTYGTEIPEEYQSEVLKNLI